MRAAAAAAASRLYRIWTGVTVLPYVGPNSSVVLRLTARHGRECDESLPGADEGDLERGFPGREPPQRLRPSRHPSDMPGGLVHEIARAHSPAAEATPGDRRDNRKSCAVTDHLIDSSFCKP